MSDTRRSLLRTLADADGPVSGPTLADELGVSRAAVWKHVEALRDEGFVVESDADGYTVRSVPDYGGDAIAFGLDAPYAVEYHDSLPSTNDRARELAVAGEAEVLVVAGEQTGGRGRLDRPWSSPPGGVYASLLCRPDRPPAHAPVFTLAAAVAVTRACREAGVEAVIKWPNDVLVAGSEGKLAGILTEMEGEADRISWLIVGVGANVDVSAADLPEKGASIRTAGGDADRRRFCQRVVEAFHDLRADPDSILPAWRDYAVTLGREVRVDTPGGVVEGEAVDVTFPGALVVRTADGERTVHAGDCEHLRPA
ncbi:biotin--[acetyl-CoA-carboxylase] ligase [Haloplanus aerogenes]|uniref:Biotin--[acetyl-CoA-carboxylase] ligase n=1 Tax=Haloplanus aerogenes TaxID=660522 RepID=A0A3G8QSU1_9EURY|nr:biotin--[acetyl-CoA-carboxylase] ligase [Haloplanus aerogenes]AZH25420.1 biotin--[acetyl-CoA-carboxylase] ligase [Haloplanus aerogenes]RMB25132.1 BirA family biotin operon repressor/biotin-[acetyl-CoA-carboxylase] ligase [Haloplanus aerogenes]